MEIANILCPTDFSDTSVHAVDLATMIASWYKARIIGLHVVSAAVAVPEFSLPRGSVDELALRSALAARFSGASRAGVGVDAFLEVGSPAALILDKAASLAADMIVMGTHGTSGFQHLVLGSVTERVLRRAACPVLTVPPRAQATRVPFGRLLCAIDFSESSMAALQCALSLAEESDARLTMLHVLDWPWEEPPPPRLEELPMEQAAALGEYRRYREKMALTRLNTLAPDSLRLSHRPVTRLSNGKPYAQILDVANEEGSDLIVIGVHGRNPFDMMVFGSTTNQVVRRATCPVLTLRR
jgi:nucleotide-binding universal stress UspA family protein